MVVVVVTVVTVITVLTVVVVLVDGAEAGVSKGLTARSHLSRCNFYESFAAQAVTHLVLNYHDGRSLDMAVIFW